MEGTGFVAVTLRNGRVRVENEDGEFMFTTTSYGNAARRAIERFREDTEGYDRFVAAGSPGNNYSSFIRPVRMTIAEAAASQGVSL